MFCRECTPISEVFCSGKRQWQRDYKIFLVTQRGRYICRTEVTERDIILMDLLKRLAMRYGIGNVADVLQEVMDREEAGSTILAPGIAMPHARVESVSELKMAIATSEKGIDFKVEGEAPVNIVILILTPKDSPATYLQAVSSLSKVCSEPDFPELVSTLESPEDVWRMIDRGGHILPEFICAGDIMERSFPHLKETDNLQNAIDMFVKHREMDLPVVDENEDLVGVVTAMELMKVCLPDYILWMEDLTPIMNFEPFAEILRNESKTWLADIMSLDYAYVSEDMPAIQVAKEITRRNTRVAFVVRGTRLVGRVTLQNFVHKVLRA